MNCRTFRRLFKVRDRSSGVNTWRTRDEWCNMNNKTHNPSLIYHERELWRRSETLQWLKMIDGGDTFSCRRYETWTACTDSTRLISSRSCVEVRWGRACKPVRQNQSGGWFTVAVDEVEAITGRSAHKLWFGVVWIVADETFFPPLFSPTETFSQSVVSIKRNI